MLRLTVKRVNCFLFFTFLILISCGSVQTSIDDLPELNADLVPIETQAGTLKEARVETSKENVEAPTSKDEIENLETNKISTDAENNETNLISTDLPIVSTENSTSNLITGNSVLESVLVIVDDGFTPDKVTVQVGGSVTWRSTQKTRSSKITSALGKFFGPRLLEGEEWTYTFETPGTYRYIDAGNKLRSGIVVVEK